MQLAIQVTLGTAAALSAMATASLLAGATFSLFEIGNTLLFLLAAAVAMPWLAAVGLGGIVWARGEGRSPDFWNHGVAVTGPAIVIGFTAAALAGGGSLMIPAFGAPCSLDNGWCLAASGTVVGTAIAWLSFGIAFPALIAPVAACVSALCARRERPVPRWQLCAAIAVAAAGFFITALFGAALGLA